MHREDSGSSSGADAGDHLMWIPHPKEVWCIASVEEGENNHWRCEVVDLMSADDSAPSEVLQIPDSVIQKDAVPVEEIHIQQGIVHDISKLYSNNYHEGPALMHFKNMFLKRTIYGTIMGEILVVMNPQKLQPDKYQNPMRFCQSDTSALPAHIYKFCNKILRILMKSNLNNTRGDRLNHSLILHGDTGSGKTETSKHASAWLVQAAPLIGNDPPESEAGKRAYLLSNVLRDSNTVFEAFGNAKTKSNDNSSRFGRYVKLQFTESNKLVSIYNETFLLEKSRLISVTSGERNYHIFYQVFRGMGSAYPELKKQLNLHSVEQFKMLTNGNSLYRQHVQEDVGGFHASVKAMVNLGTSEEELKELWTLLAVMLHLGNASIEQERTDEACSIQIDTMPFNDLADLLGLSADVFVQAVTTLTVTGNGRIKSAKDTPLKSSHVNLSREEVYANILGFLKHIYKGIYFWLVRKANHAGAYHGSILGLPVKFVGIMDVYGYEGKEVNSLEQLCINYAEERLKKQFNEKTFSFDRSLFEEEGIEVDCINFKDNQTVIDYIIKKPAGLLPTLDDVTMKKVAGKDELLTAFQESVAICDSTLLPESGNSPVKFSSQQGASFVVTHFTGDVTYVLDEFLSKNNDASAVDYTALLSSSQNTFLKATLGIGNMVHEGEVGHIPWLNNPLIMPVTINALKTKSIANTNTVSSQFTSQLDTMTSNLDSTRNHFVKCIRPNGRTPQEDSGVLDVHLLNRQLHHHGIHEIISYIKHGFPERMEFKDFYKKFETLKSSFEWPNPSHCTEELAKKLSLEIVDNLLEPSSFKIGKTTMFMQDGVSEFLENMILDLRNANASLIQAHWKRFTTRRQFLENIVKWRQKKATAEFARAMFQSDSQGKRAAARHHSVQVDVFSAINSMRSMSGSARRSTSSNSAMANIFAPIDPNETSEDTEHIKKLQNFYLSKMELIKSFIRNVIVQRRINGIFEAVETGDKEAVMHALRRRPELIDSLDKNNEFRSLRHAAIQTGNMTMIQVLGITPMSIVQKDAGDHACSHYAALAPNLNLFKLFQKTLSTLISLPKDQKDALSTATTTSKKGRETKPRQRVRTLTLAPNHGQDKRDSSAGDVGGSVRRSGFMHKLNNSGRLAKRWCSLEKNRFKYWYVQPEKEQNDAIEYQYVDEFRITRQECFFSRYAGGNRGDLFIVMNFASPSLKKRRKKIIWKANSEADLFAWLTVLSQVASFDRFRAYAPRFRNPNLSRVWLSQLTWARESALHTLVHDSNAKLRKSRKAVLRDNIHMAHNDNAVVFDALVVASWLIDNGCPVNQKNYEGQTALHLAVEGGNVPMAICLVRKGAQLEVKDFKAVLPTDLCDNMPPSALGFPDPPSDYFDDGILSEDGSAVGDTPRKSKNNNYNAEAIHSKVTEIANGLKQALRLEHKEYINSQSIQKADRLLPSPLTMNMGLRAPADLPISKIASSSKKGFSFINMFLQKQVVDASEYMSSERMADLENFRSVINSGKACMQVSVFNGYSHQLIEPSQTLEKPIYIDAENAPTIYWGHTVFIQTPLEFLPDLCYIQFRLYLKGVESHEIRKRGKRAQRRDRYEEDEDYDTDEDAAPKRKDSREDLDTIDVEVSQASYVLDKSTIDSGMVRVTLRDTRGEIRNIGGNRDERDGVVDVEGVMSRISHSSVSLKGFKRGGSSQSILEADFTLNEYFEPLTIADILMRKTDSIQSYASGSYLNNPQHLAGAPHDKSNNKNKRGLVKTTPFVFALSYFEGAASERHQITLPKYAKAGDIIKNIGGLKYVDLCVPGHVRSGQSVFIVVPKYTSPADAKGMIEVRVDDFSPNRGDVVRLKYTLSRGVTPGPYVVQNTDGSRHLQFQVTEFMVSSLETLDDSIPGLDILIVMNNTMHHSHHSRQRKVAHAVGKEFSGTSIGNVFGNFMNKDQKESHEGKDAFSSDSSYSESDSDSSDNLSIEESVGSVGESGDDESIIDVYDSKATFDASNPMRTPIR